jgi:hypothetical protein
MLHQDRQQEKTVREAKLLEGESYLKKARRVADFVEQFFQDSGQTEWPTFRTVTYRCNCTQTQLLEFCNEGIHGLMQTQYNTSPATPLRDHFVEICK